MRGMLLPILLTSLAFGALDQEFEAVVIKPNKSGTLGSSSHSNLTQLTATNMSLRSLILRAYGLKEYQVEGPSWLADEHFDIAAKFPEGVAKDKPAAMQSMLQKMLADRFKLAVHRETRTFPVYGLLLGKGKLKMKEVQEGPRCGTDGENNHYVLTCITMAELAEFIARRTDRPVVDMTGLKGFYDMEMDFVPESRRPADAKPDAGAPPDPGATVQMVLQEQLNLKLESRKAPLEFLIVDHAEKAPIEN